MGKEEVGMKKLLCIVLIFMMMLTSGCVEKKAKPSTSRKYLVYNLGEKPEDLLMIKSDNYREKDLLLALFEGLVREDKYGQIVPAMAEKIHVSDDEIGYTFILRKDMHFSNGTEIKAEDFVRFFHDILLEKENIYAKQLYCIFGAKDFSMGKVDFEKVAIVAKDNLTLEIRLNSPNDYFKKILSNPVFTLRKINLNLKKWEDNYEEILYSGPFTIKGVNREGEISLLKNEKYWRADEIVSSEMLFTTIKDEEKALADFETTEYSNTSKIDIFVSPPLSEVMSLSIENKTQAIPSQSMYYLIFNLKTNTLTGKKDAVDINFRSAISEVIDRKLIIQTIWKDLAVPAMSYTPSSNNDNSSKVIFNGSGNKVKGLEYLNKSNFEKGEKIYMVYEMEKFDTVISEEIAKNIKEHLNINVVSTGYKRDDLEEILKKGDYDIVFSRIHEDYGDDSKFFSRWTSNSTYNIYGYRNSEYDKIIESAWKEGDNKIKLYNDAQEILAKDLPCIPIYVGNTVICKRENIKDIYATKNGNLIFDYAYKEDNSSTK